jgi:predicted GNAT superfamily acetyltransferase
MMQIRRLTGVDQFAAVDALYREVFGITGDDTGLNVRLLSALAANSAHVLGAYSGSRLVGFGVSFLARDPSTGRLYQYSQTVAVAPDMQTKGVGRLVKSAQRDAALEDGIELLRWVFDPMYARNAHFNLDVLGGRVRRLHRDFYGPAAPGRDRGERTDRLLVDWELWTSPSTPQAPLPELVPHPGHTCEFGDQLLIGIPADWHVYRTQVGPQAAAGLRASVVDALAKAFDRGLVATSCRRVDDTSAVYLLTCEESS